MRSFLGFLFLVALLLGVFAFAVLPVAGPGLVSAVIRGTPPLAGQDVTVTAQVTPAALLQGAIGRIDLAGPSVGIGPARANAVAVSIDGLSVIDRSFSNLDGHAALVVITEPDGTFIELHDARISGDSESLDALGEIRADEVTRLLAARLAFAGVPIEAIRLETGVIVLSAGGQEVASRLSIEGDSVVLTPEAGLQPVTVSAGLPAPWELVALDVTPAGITVHARLAGARLG
jgi:hypothetical protein